MGGQYFDDKVTAENDKEALDKFVKLVDENKANVIDDEKFFSTDKIYVTYEVLKDESTEDRTVEKTSTP
jgi:uncharacterized protein (UPF0305 family)